MTTEKYYTIATKRGKEKIQDYYRQNKTLPLTHMGFGGVDGDDANYQRPNVEMAVVPSEWARIGIERKPDEGFIGGGATIENKVDEYKGKWICNVGIYDEDGELILISAYRPLLVDPEESIVSSYPINIQSVLANAEHVVVQTDTSITHPTHDEMNQALEELDNKLSKYATTDAAGLIELATHQEVSTGQDTKRAVTPATLKPELDEIKELINESEGSLSQPATTERLGLTELATQQEVDQRTSGEQVVTAQTLDKPGLISFLQRYADEEVKKLKELIFGGNPSAALDTLFELSNAYEDAADSIQSVLNTLSTKLPTSTFETFQTTYNQWKSQIQAQVNRKWEAVDASTSRKGIVQLTNAVNSTSQALAASALGLKTAYDKAVSAYNLANGKWTAVNASTSVKGIVKLVDSVTSTSTSDAATPNSVRQAKALAQEALDKANSISTEVPDFCMSSSKLLDLGGVSSITESKFKLDVRSYSDPLIASVFTNEGNGVSNFRILESGRYMITVTGYIQKKQGEQKLGFVRIANVGGPYLEQTKVNVTTTQPNAVSLSWGGQLSANTDLEIQLSLITSTDIPESDMSTQLRITILKLN
ncbi:tail fiber protein [Vibrio sp. Sgm 5]|uniref:tail fiber protein n=1 Tax=Vibrio sp. Sgm 5 TaxID=2994387 RepID=UPI0022489703|nr:tail fiber protein [Vibrio sp. Sgm 5]MCX2788333.1 tail fiber protein [Vibrio sp. Sgm 5]